jgi:hypothetical protein
MIVLVILSPRALAGTPPTEAAEAAETGTRTAEA